MGAASHAGFHTKEALTQNYILSYRAYNVSLAGIEGPLSCTILDLQRLPLLIIRHVLLPSSKPFLGGVSLEQWLGHTNDMGDAFTVGIAPDNTGITGSRSL